jgi:hypothetical protein
MNCTSIRPPAARYNRGMSDEPIKPHGNWWGWSTFVLRNAMVGIGSLAILCAVDYAVVKHGVSVNRAWADQLSVPAYFVAMLWINRNLYRGRLGGATRIVAALVTASVAAVVMGYWLLVGALWFHFSIGGTL